MTDGPTPNDRRTSADPRQTPGSAHFRAQPPRPTPSGRLPGQTPRTTPGMAGLPGAPPPDPTALGMWRVEAPIAKGGMGAVFRARHVQTGKAAAVKVILAGANATDAQRGRFTREVDALAALDHPGIVRVLDAGTWAGAPWFAMELVEGPDLSRAWPQLGPRERLQVVLGVAQAVGHAHAHGYVHRDLKPENVLLARDGAALRPLVTDFGLAKRVAGESRLTATGAVVGTPHHMAPEQVLGQGREAGPQTDVWAVGTMLHQALFGRVPFDAEATLELFAQIVDRPPPPLDDAARAACAAAEVDPEDVDLVRRRALAKDPLDRHPTAALLASDLERVLRGEAPASRASGLLDALARRARRNPRRALLALGALLVATVALGVAVRVGRDVLRRRRAEDARAAARLELGAAHKALERAAASAALPDLAAALAAAEQARTGAVDGLGPELAELAAARRRARLAQAALGLAEESADGAALAGAGAAEVEADAAASQDERRLALLLGGRAAARAGDPRAAELARRLAEAGDAAGAALVTAAAALGADDPAGALAALEPQAAALEAAPAPLAVEAALARADALLRLGRTDEARRALAGAAEAEAPRGLAARRGAHLLAGAAFRLDVAGAGGTGLAAWLAARPGDALADEAWRLAVRGAEESPADDPRAARLLLALARPLGRSVEARERLDLLARRAGAGPAFQAVLALAKLDLGEPVDAAAGAPEARLRAADLAGLDGDAAAWDGLAAVSTAAPGGGGDEVRAVAAAARVRALAERGGLDAARRALAQLDAGPAPVHDLPSSPLSARAARDAGWARLLLGDAAGAAAAARLALVGRPWDLDAAALLARAGAEEGAATLAAAWGREGPALDGPLGRGVLLARAAELWERPEAAGEAVALLRTRLAGDPAVRPAAQLLERAARFTRSTAPALRPDPLPWAALLAHVVDPPPATPEDLADARPLALEVGADDGETTDRCRRAVALAPLWPRASWELAGSLERSETGNDGAVLGWSRYARLKPSYGLLAMSRLRTLWNATSSTEPKSDGVRAIAAGPEEPLRHVPALLDPYCGLWAAPDSRTRWTRGADPRQLIARLDRLVARDARLVFLLPVRAHLAELAHESPRCDRDLALARRLYGQEKDAHEDDSSGVYVDVYAAAILVAGRRREALRALDAIPRCTVEGADKNDLHTFLFVDPLWEPIRKEPEWRAFSEWFAR